MTMKRPYVVHLRYMTKNANGDRVRIPETWAATVVFVPEEDGGLKAGMALCLPGDQFNRKLGRQIAEGRARMSTTWAMNLDCDPIPANIPHNLYKFWAREYIAQQIQLSKNKPTRKIFADLHIPTNFLLGRLDDDKFDDWYEKALASFDKND